MLSELHHLMAEPVEGEASLCLEILDLPVSIVPREDLAVLRANGMLPNQCHQNTFEFARLDPSGRSRVVTGWRCDTPIPRLHSVVAPYGGDILVCITPGPVPMLKFRIDRELELRADGKHLRRGRVAPPLLRLDPLQTIEDARKATGLLEAGADPSKMPQELMMRLGLLFTS